MSDISCQIAGQVPGVEAVGGLDFDDWIDPREQRKQDRFIQLGLVAACQAIEDSDWKPQDRESQNRTGVMIGSGIGGLESIVKTDQLMNEKGPRRISPFFIPSALINLISGHVSIRYGFRGPNHAVVTACSTGAHAIGDAARMVALDDADVMVAGGAEAAVCRIGMAGFAAARALSTSYNDSPEVASRPWDNRYGTHTRIHASVNTRARDTCTRMHAHARCMQLIWSRWVDFASVINRPT